MDIFQIRDKRILITGASSGLGRHFAAVLAKAGAAVTLAARRSDAIERVCADIRKAGGSAVGLQMDVSEAASVKAAFDAVSEPFDVVINNAGISGAKLALEMSENDWSSVVDTNLKGTFLVSRFAAEQMLETTRGGSIVNIASILGLRVAGGVSAYTASKAGVVHLTKALALEWARYGIRVNALCPGYIETDINRTFFASDAGLALISRIPQRRLGQPEDLDGPLLLLCSQASKYMTGSSICVDGGHLVSTL